jgi:hypothetical protein
MRVAFAVVAAFLVGVPGSCGAPPRPPLRPPQFVVVSFEGAGGAPLWRYWRSVAKRTGARFTFFVSGVYLIDWDHHGAYRPPRHARGTSAIGFAPTAAWAAGTLRQIALGYREGNEVGTHYNGHFCAPDPGGVATWSAADWTSEVAQFRRLLFAHASRLPFGPSEVVGGRTPCLEGKPAVLYPVLARLGFRYDASQTALPGGWPRREHGIWSFPLLEIPFVGHTFRVVSMDYNFLANQTEEGPRQIEAETYRSLWNAFRASYHGGRAPLSIGYHFETWEDGAYDRALTRFLTAACRLREVRCTTFRALADWLDSLPRRALRRYREGRFPPFKRR